MTLEIIYVEIYVDRKIVLVKKKKTLNKGNEVMGFKPVKPVPLLINSDGNVDPIAVVHLSQLLPDLERITSTVIFSLSQGKCIASLGQLVFHVNQAFA